MKLLNLIFLLLAIQMSLFIYVMGSMTNNGGIGPYNESQNSFFCHNVNNYTNYNDENQTIYDDENTTSGSLAGVRWSSPDLWTMIMCPADGNSSRMIGMLIAFAWLMGAVGFFAFANRSDISLLVIPFLFLLGAGAPTIVQLYTFINNQVSALACGAVTGACFMGQFCAIIIAGPLLISWVAACVSWWTGREI
jgi:hypothetical protein